MFDILMGLVALMGAAQASAHAPAPASPAAPQVWDLEWEQPHCTITTGTEDGSALMLSMTPGDPAPGLYFWEPQKQLSVVPNETATVTLQPGGKTFHALAYPAKNVSKPALLLGTLGYRFVTEFSHSSSVSVEFRKRTFSMPIIGADKAMAAVHQCIDKKLAEWGLDAAAYEALRKPPTDIDGYYWITANDYPKDAVQRNWAGDVVVLLSVDASGKVTGCKPLISGGMRSVDDVTCRAAVDNGRFNPAIGADGRPTAAFRVADVVFRLWG